MKTASEFFHRTRPYRCDIAMTEFLYIPRPLCTFLVIVSLVSLFIFVEIIQRRLKHFGKWWNKYFPNPLLRRYFKYTRRRRNRAACEL